MAAALATFPGQRTADPRRPPAALVLVFFWYCGSEGCQEAIANVPAKLHKHSVRPGIAPVPPALWHLRFPTNRNTRPKECKTQRRQL